MRMFVRFLRGALAVALALGLTGCSEEEGEVFVDVGSAPLAAAYRVDLYADEPGLDLVEGVFVTQSNQVTLSDIPAGRWALLIQAQNGDLTTIGHYQTDIEVFADRTTEVTAGTYIPGLPGDPLPETETSLTSFGPDGDALFTALYAAGIDSLPAAAVTLELLNGEGEPVTTQTTVTNRALGGGHTSLQCGTCFINHQDAQNTATNQVRGQEVRPQLSIVNTGETVDLFIATTFQTVTCQRLLTDAQTQNCVIFAEVLNGNPVITDARALEIAQGFDSDNPFQDGDNGIYADTRSRFGSEWTTNGGRDGDNRVALVFVSANSIGGAGLFGFFNPADQRDPTNNSASNGGEILYINADRSTADLYDALGTIAHEMVHLIIFNQKVAQEGAFPEGASSENAVLDEGLAVLNEELSGFTYTGDQGGNFFLLTSVNNLLNEGLNRRFFQFTGQLADYGAGYLFWRYVHDQQGIDTITQITTTTAVGRENITAVLNEPFADVFQRYTQAVALNGVAGVPAELQFTNLDLFGSFPSREGTDFNFNGLQGIRAITLPGSLTVNETLEPWGTIFYRADGGDGSALTWRATGIAGLATGVAALQNAQ